MIAPDFVLISFVNPYALFSCCSYVMNDCVDAFKFPLHLHKTKSPNPFFLTTVPQLREYPELKATQQGSPSSQNPEATFNFYSGKWLIFLSLLCSPCMKNWSSHGCLPELEETPKRVTKNLIFFRSLFLVVVATTVFVLIWFLHLRRVSMSPDCLSCVK